MPGELKLVETDDEWQAYHSIRERVLWSARGLGGDDRHRQLAGDTRPGE